MQDNRLCLDGKSSNRTPSNCAQGRPISENSNSKLPQRVGVSRPKAFRIVLILLMLGLVAVASVSQAQPSLLVAGGELLNQVTVADALEGTCGKKLLPAEHYTKISLYAPIGALAFLLLSIMADNKKFKAGFGTLALIPFALWVYVNFSWITTRSSD